MMILKWESERERLIRFMKIPARKKLEWLYEMNRFVAKYSVRNPAGTGKRKKR